MTPFSSNAELNEEHRAYQQLSALVHGVYVLALLVIGLWCVAQLVSAGGISTLTWKQGGKLAIGIPISLYLAATLNSQRGYFAYLSVWEQSLLKRRELEELKDALRKGRRAMIEGIEVELVDGFVTPKRKRLTPPKCPPVEWFKGEKQTGAYHCVFASIVGAVNTVAGKTVWTQDTLLAKWREQGIPDAELNFANIWPVAIQPVQNEVTAQHHLDGATAMPNDEYVKMIKECVDACGVAIVSFENADFAGSKLNRKNSWHMLSIINAKGDNFEAWDTASGNKINVTADQLVTHVPYGHAALAVHNKHDVLLIQPV